MTRLGVHFSSVFIVITAGLLLLATASASASPNQLPTCQDLGIDLTQDSCRTYCSSLGYDGVTNPGSSLVTSSSTSSCMCKGMNDNTLEAICQSATATASSPSLTPDASSASPTPIYSPKSTCESMGITNIDECGASCEKYFPGGYMGPAFGPYVDHQLQDPAFCLCKAVDDVAENDRYICGATTEVYFTCKEVNVTDVNTCDDVCKQDTSTPGTTFHGGWVEEHSLCECFADVPNSGEFNYCGGPPPPPASGVLPTCSSIGLLFERQCERYCRDYLRIDYPQFQQLNDDGLPPPIQCLCSTGAGCKDEASPSPSSGNNLGVWASSLMLLTATVMVFSL